MARTPTFAPSNAKGSLWPDPASGWFEANALFLDTWLTWQGDLWRSYQNLQTEWLRQWQRQVNGWPAFCGAFRGAEQLA